MGIYDKEGYTQYDIEYSGLPYGDHLRDIARRISCADLVVGFNLKFDLHWLRRYIPNLKVGHVYDCQLVEFVLSDQINTYPSLDWACEKRGLGKKLDVVRTEYWERGIDTPDIPLDILSDYLKQDIMLTYQLFQAQRQVILPEQRQLLALQFEDLLVLQEMEYNGMLYDTDTATKLGRDAHNRILEIDASLQELAGSRDISLNSDDHISCLLYGGDIDYPVRERYVRTLKDGTEKQRERWTTRTETFPQLVKPIRGSETLPTSKFVGDDALAAENTIRAIDGKKPYRRRWSVSEPVLRQLKAKGKAKRIIELMLERSKLAKLDSTYYSGLVHKFTELEWENDLLHGSFNQCVARTGRLSSSNPNLQNFAGDIKGLFYSRF